MMIFRKYEIAGRTIALVVGIAALMLLAFAVPSCLSNNKRLKTESRVAEGQAGAAIDSGAEAMNTVSNVASSDAATDDAVATGQAEVAAAAKGKKGAAARRAACRLKAYQNTPACKEPVQ